MSVQNAPAALLFAVRRWRLSFGVYGQRQVALVPLIRLSDGVALGLHELIQKGLFRFGKLMFAAIDQHVFV